MLLERSTTLGFFETADDLEAAGFPADLTGCVLAKAHAFLVPAEMDGNSFVISGIFKKEETAERAKGDDRFSGEWSRHADICPVMTLRAGPECFMLIRISPEQMSLSEDFENEKQ